MVRRCTACWLESIQTTRVRACLKCRGTGSCAPLAAVNNNDRRLVMLAKATRVGDARCPTTMASAASAIAGPASGRHAGLPVQDGLSAFTPPTKHTRSGMASWRTVGAVYHKGLKP